MMKLFSMFTGFGGAEWGLKRANVPYEIVGYSEIDKYAIQCLEQNFPESKGKNFGSCKDINPDQLPDFDLLTGGFPCQDVSLAGKRDLTKGRTMLINDVFRIIDAKKPKYIMLENVKGLLSMNDGYFFKSIIYTLDNLGYGVLYKVLNSKEHGIPQNRERIWIMCKLGGWEFMEFQFPEKEELKIFVKDILQDKVDKKYYLSKTQLEGIERSNFLERKPLPANSKVMNSLKVGGDVKPITLYKVGSEDSSTNPHYLQLDKGNHSKMDRYYFDDSIAPTLSGTINVHPCLTEAIGRQGSSSEFKKSVEVLNNIRRLTPKECFRLMGFLNDEIDLKGISDTQCYKLAGNGWDVNVVEKIFRKLFK